MPVLHIQAGFKQPKLCRNLSSLKGLDLTRNFVKQRIPCVSRTSYTDILSGLIFARSLSLNSPSVFTHEHLSLHSIQQAYFGIMYLKNEQFCRQLDHIYVSKGIRNFAGSRNLFKQVCRVMTFPQVEEGTKSSKPPSVI